jgi:hypothetical protein
MKINPQKICIKWAAIPPSGIIIRRVRAKSLRPKLASKKMRRDFMRQKSLKRFDEALFPSRLGHSFESRFR